LVALVNAVKHGKPAMANFLELRM